MTGLNESITLSFMIVGHTKFSPDSSFGLFKQKFRKSAVETLKDIGDVVVKSASCNSFEMVGWEDGTPLIPTYDWSTFFATKMKKLKGIKKYQHFSFNSSQNGKVICATESDSPTTTINILKDGSWSPSCSILPNIVPPKGLDSKRQWYLYEKIRPFCLKEENKDIVCPLPTTPKPADSTPATPLQSPIHLSTLQSPIHLSNASNSSSPEPPPTKKKRKCGKCGEIGHNSRTCTH